MEELSLNATFIMREELYAWELDRAVRRASGTPADDSLHGLFVPPGAYVGSGPAIVLPPGVTLPPEAAADAQAYMKRELSKIGVVELANLMGGSKLDETPPAYSLAAKNLMEQFKGNRDKIFQEEAVNVFSIYIAPLFPRYRLEVLQNWTRQFGSPEDEKGWVQKALTQLPALHHFIDIMTAADQQPTRKDHYHHFMDNEIMVAPLAYGTVFVAKDRAIRDMLHKRTKILARTKCMYCDSFGALETWLASMPV